MVSFYNSMSSQTSTDTSSDRGIKYVSSFPESRLSSISNTPPSTFSPEGRLFQVEYSLEAIKLGSTAIGVSPLLPPPLFVPQLTYSLPPKVATGSGVILGVEKRVTSTLLETSSVEKIVEIDRHIGCAMSGLQADARSMVEHARVESQNHAFHYNEPLRVESCTQSICDLAIRFGEGAEGEESIMSRPFGVALLVAGIDEDGPQLYATSFLPYPHPVS